MRGGASIIDNIKEEDEILCFFPCVRFEDQILLHFRGQASNQKKWNDERKLEHDIKLHKELHNLYIILTMLVIVCCRKNIPLIIENPYSTQHYLHRYWALKPKVIDYDRHERGDYFKKPTQYRFINREPANNFILEYQTVHKLKKITGKGCESGIKRSLISKEYANRFIREFIIQED